MTPIKDQLREARIKAGFSLSQMGEAIGIDRASIAAYESGRKRNPGADMILKWVIATNARIIFEP
jgi:transcriptional regulator with XRE-family HTH domain